MGHRRPVENQAVDPLLLAFSAKHDILHLDQVENGHAAAHGRGDEGGGGLYAVGHVK
jgi:hypothetical protein